MALTKYKLGDLIIPFKEKCGISNLTPYEVSGVNRDKEFFEPSNQVGEDTSNYQNVPPHFFACNLMHVGRDVVLPIAYNHTEKTKHVSPAYSVFSIRKDIDILDEYFFIYLKSDERDRFFWFHTDASIRDGMTWDDFCDIDIELPPLPIQQKYVDVYNSMVENQKSYERGLEDLKLTCDAYIEDLRRHNPCEEIGPYIDIVNESNTDKKVDYVQGVESSSSFMDTRANMEGVDISNYTIVRTGNIAYNPSRINLGSIALYNKQNPCIVSPMYCVFKIIDVNKIIPEYLMLWFSRKEFQRYTWFYGAGSVRDTFDFNLMKEVKFPIPSKENQQAIVDIYNSYNTRKSINEQLKSQIKSICPILIKGSIEEAKRF